MSSINIENKLRQFKRRYYLQALLRGLLYWASLSGVALLVVISLESQFWFSSLARALLYFCFVSLCVGGGGYWVLLRLWRLCYSQRLFSDETAARAIGKRLPNIRDTLLNYVQLRRYAAESQLAEAGLVRRTNYLRHMLFTEALPWKKSARFFQYFLSVCGVFLLIWWLNPKFISESSERIYHYERAYDIPMPFRFVLEDKVLAAFADEPYELRLKIKGTYVPKKAYVVVSGRYIRMQEEGEEQFLHRFESVHKDISFHFEADGYSSRSYVVRVLRRPSLLEAALYLRYPTYTGIPSEELNQLKNMKIPEGSWVRWNLQAKATDSISLRFGKGEPVLLREDLGIFSTEKRFFKASSYSIHLKNRNSSNKEALSYRINVRKDEVPQLYPRVFSDTVLYKVVVVAGSATDDYGLSKIRLQYKRQKDGKLLKEGLLAVPFKRQNRRQAVFYLQWQLDSLGLVEGEVLSYRIQAWDNDGIRGAKAAYSLWYQLQVPDSKAIEKQLTEEGHRSSSSMQQSQAESKSLQKQIKSLQDRIKLKKSLDWQDKKQLKDLIEKREHIDKQIKDLKDQQTRFEEKAKRFDVPSEELKEKMKQLRELLDEVLDPEAKKLYEELRKLMEKGAKLPQVQNMLGKLAQKEQLQSRNLERAISLMKRLQYDLRTQQVEKQLKALKEAQEGLRKKTKAKEATEKLAEEQQLLQKSFRSIEKSLEELQDLQNELDIPQYPLEFQKDREQIHKDQQQSEQYLRQKKRKAAQQSQRAVEKRLEQMQKKLQEARSKANAQQIEVDIVLMQKLLDNLIVLSLKQEVLEVRMGGEESLSYLQQDEIAKAQLEVQEATRATLDSLSSFAKRNFQISSQLYKEIQSLETQLEESLEAMRERRSSKARTQQRYAMTSFNKLALFVSELLDQLAESQQSGGGMGEGEQMSPAQLQQQLLKQIQELKKSDKKGEQMSEELARMIAEQEAIRRQLEEFSRSREGLLSEKKALEQLLQKMKEMEKRLAHKDLSESLIKEQRKISTRLLDFERAAKEDKEDEKRKSEQAKFYEKVLPSELKPYKADWQSDLMQLKLQSLPLNTYYEEEVRKYLERLQKEKSIF